MTYFSVRHVIYLVCKTGAAFAPAVAALAVVMGGVGGGVRRPDGIIALRFFCVCVCGYVPCEYDWSNEVIMCIERGTPVSIGRKSVLPQLNETLSSSPLCQLHRNDR